MFFFSELSTKYMLHKISPQVMKNNMNNKMCNFPKRL